MADNKADPLLSQGNVFYNNQDYEASIPFFVQAVAQYGEKGQFMSAAVARHQLGFALLGARRFFEAITRFEENQHFHSTQGRPKDAANYLTYIATAWQQQGDGHKALEYLRQAHNLAPDSIQKVQLEREMIQLNLALDHPDAAHTMITAAHCHHPPKLYDTYIRPWVEPFQLSPGSCDDFWWPLGVTAGLLVAAIVWVWPANGTLLLVSLCLSVFAGEGILRGLYGTVPVRHFLFTPNSVTRFAPAQGMMPGVTYQESRFTINDVGLRGDPFPQENGVFKVVVIGGSTVENLFLDDADAWPRQLQKGLQVGRRIWVGNSGKSGLNSFGHLVQMHYHLQEMKPQLLVVMAGINDLNQCISGGLAALKDNARLAKNVGYKASYRQHVFERVDWSKKHVWQWQRLWQRVKERKTPVAHTEKKPYVVQDKAGLFYQTQRRQRQRAEKIQTEPNIEACLTVFGSNLTRMTRMAKAARVPLVLMTQGSLYKTPIQPEEEALLWFGAVGHNFFGPQPVRQYYATEVMSRLLARYNKTTRTVCRTESIPCFDTDKALPKDRTTYYDDVHFNKQGAYRLGKKLSAFLLAEGWI